jgi:hypothetical protein
MTEEVQELEVETQETNPIEDLINNITAGELNKAEGSFNDILNNKLADSLEAQRIQVAQDVFNTPEGLDDEEDIVDETIEDEDETLELGGEGEDGLDADIEAEDEISDEEIEDAIEQIFDEDEEILAELDDDED